MLVLTLLKEYLIFDFSLRNTCNFMTKLKLLLKIDKNLKLKNISCYSYKLLTQGLLESYSFISFISSNYLDIFVILGQNFS